MPGVRELIPIREFSSGRRTVVLNRVRPIAERRGLAQMIAHIDRALAHELQTRWLENRWSSRDRGREHPERLPALDAQIDQVLVGIRDIARGHARGLADDHPTAVLVTELTKTIFPLGVQAVISLPYIDQVLAVEAIVARLQNGMAATATALGLDARVTELATLNAEYRRLIDAGRDAVDYPTVRAARERGQLYLRELIAMIIGTFYDSDAAGHIEARAELLAPIEEQLALLQKRARARRRGQPEADETADETAEAEAEPREAAEPDADADDAASNDAARERRLTAVLAAERAADLADGIAVTDDPGAARALAGAALGPPAPRPTSRADA